MRRIGFYRRDRMDFHRSHGLSGTSVAARMGINRIVVDGSQVLDETQWMDGRSTARHRHTDDRRRGGGFRATIGLWALREYWRAVTDRTTQVVRALRPEDLDEAVTTHQLRRLASDEGVITTSAAWV